MEVNSNMTIGERVRRLRKERGLPAMVLAKQARVGQSTIWLLEKYNIVPDSYSARERIARALGMTAEQLFGEAQLQEV
jgi:transcriptional regulator with XRE-family HTH domain